MDFSRNLFGNKLVVSESVSAAKVSPQLGFLKARGDEKLALLRYLATCGQMNATKLQDYLAMFEKFRNELGPEKKAYILKSAPMMDPKLEGGRMVNGYEQLRWSLVQIDIDEVNKIMQMVKVLPVEPASVELLKQIIQESDELQRQMQLGKP